MYRTLQQPIPEFSPSEKINTKMRFFASFVLVLFMTFDATMKISAKEQRTHTDIILSGCLGDLSKKYLWQGIFELFVKHVDEKHSIAFYGISRDSYQDGTAKLSRILQERLTCKKEDKICDKKRHEFIQKVRYFQLKEDQHFRTFGTFLKSKSSQLETDVIQGRIFYLAIPPVAYSSMAEKFHNCCLMRGSPNWSRLILEKPFGSDTTTAQKMAAAIRLYFKEEEIYRVDHYLGKAVVKQILPFRVSNKDLLEPLLNRNFVERVEIVMKENFGVKGRIEFYNQYGVIRDVMQNHLSELLALVAMDLPPSVTTEETDRNRLNILKHVRPLTSRQLLTGQYSRYAKEALDENVNISVSAYTPTYGAALLYIDNIKWQNVPFLIVSGKHLDQRASYIRIIFKDKDFCVSFCHHQNGSRFHGSKQIIFQIGHGDLPTAGILVSKNLFKPDLPKGLRALIVTTHDSSVYGQNINDYNFVIPTEDTDAYVALIEDMYKGHHQNFVSTDRLMMLWKIWTPLFSIKNSPKIYMESVDLSLNFQIINNGIEFASKYEVFIDKPIESLTHMASLPQKFLNGELVVKNLDKLHQIISDNIHSLAQKEIRAKGSFHIAFSGGRTPENLFRTLVTLYSEFPWRWTHIWQVDERCVVPGDVQSNFRSIQIELLEFINIPYYNIHPMPVFQGGQLCTQNSVDSYTKDLNFYLKNLSFDLILLGVGTDGHTASLFPGSPLLDVMDSLVSLTSQERSPKRLTMLYPLINKSKNIFAIVTGKSKQQVIENISDDKQSKYKYPILGVHPSQGNVSFYFDYDAWFGE